MVAADGIFYDKLHILALLLQKLISEMRVTVEHVTIPSVLLFF